MVNHCRTLLLNCRPTGRLAEYVSPDYRPRVLPPALRDVWDRLFGASAGDDALNYRAAQLMAVVHGTDLVRYVTALDPVTTYWPPRTGALSEPEPEGLVPLTQLVDDLSPYMNSRTTSGNRTLNELGELWEHGKLWAHKLGVIVLTFIYSVKDLDEVEKH